jgi:hypothetical protein
MADGLRRIIESGAPSTVIPRRVYVDARDFFQSALEAAGDAVPANPSASIANYIIASQTLNAGKPPAPVVRNELRERLTSYNHLLQLLSEGHPPEPADTQTVKELCGFFAELQNEAESEAYQRVMRFDITRPGFRLV